MDPLQNNESLANNNGFDSYLQPPTDVIQMGQPSLNDFYDTDYFSATDNIPSYTNTPTTSVYEQQFMPSSVNNRHVPTIPSSHAPQYTSLNVNEQNPSQSIQNIFSPILNSPQTNIPSYTNTPTTRNYEQQFMPSSVNNGHVPTIPSSHVPQHTSLNVNEQNPPQSIQNIFSPNSPQTNGIFRFEIPGFKIIIIPTSSPVVNFNNFNMLQQDLNDSSIATNNLQPQLQQPNSLDLNESFINFNNFRG